LKVLVTGAGGPAGVCVIKALKDVYDVVGVDMDNFASGLYLVDRAYVVPPANNETFISKILEVCCREKVSFIIPTVSEELMVFSENLALFEKKNIHIAVSGKASLEIANNKLNTYQFFSGMSYCPAIYSVLDCKFPCVVKPVNSRGARGFFVCDDRDSLLVALKKNTLAGYESVIMEYLTGPEYSVYGLSDLNGCPLVCVVNLRIRAGGESKVAKIVDNPGVAGLACEIAQKLNLVGPWNVQLMGSEGNFKLVEVNPRVAGSLSLVVAAGLKYAELIVKIFTGQPISSDELKYDFGLFMTRYNEEIFLKPQGLINNA